MNVADLQVVVRDRREDLEMTQSELATRAGVGRQWLVGFETGRMKNPRWESLSAIFSALDMELVARPRQNLGDEDDADAAALLDRSIRGRVSDESLAGSSERPAMQAASGRTDEYKSIFPSSDADLPTTDLVARVREIQHRLSREDSGRPEIGRPGE